MLCRVNEWISIMLCRMTAIQLTIPLQKGRNTVAEAPSRHWKIKSKEGFQDADALTIDHLRIISAVPRKHPVLNIRVNLKKTIVLLSLSIIFQGVN